MEKRPYFVGGDLLTNALAGAVAALAARATVWGAWNPVLAMPAGMLTGMLASLPVILIAMPLFGAFEVMLPAMLTGMLAGMVVGMMDWMSPLTISRAALYGAGVGLFVVTWVYLVTARAGRNRNAGFSHRA